MVILPTHEFGAFVSIDSVRVVDDSVEHVKDVVATEVPLTIIANDIEIATLLTSPSYIKELVFGYLFTSGFIKKCSEISNYWLDDKKWAVYVELPQPPDASTMRKRLYTASCGKCAMYTNVNEIALRHKLKSDILIKKETVFELAERLKQGSDLFNKTGAVHTAILNCTDYDISIDDIARHNAVDKVIGKALLDTVNLHSCILARTGRTSSEIVYKVRSCEIPITIARGAPTHQAIHLCREMGVTLVGFARQRTFNIYSSPERISV